MYKVYALFLHSSVEPIYANPGFCKTCSDLHIDFKRAARLLVLLQQLDESVDGLKTLREPELSEIVSTAIRVSGFVDLIEAEDVIAMVLDAIKMQDPIREGVTSQGQWMALSDA
jgi:hypothetical protein